MDVDANADADTPRVADSKEIVKSLSISGGPLNGQN